MCCLFGIYDYGHSLTAAQKKRLVSALAVASEDRGTDATGIAYNRNGHLTVYKRPYPAHLMRFRLPDDAVCIMGHTRMTTQGNEKHNYNNHPFEGTAGIPFALAHNGVLYNDLTLRMDKNLPRTRIETDSYVAVQLLAQQGELSFRSIRSAVEPLRGTLTLSVLDSRDNLHIIKGNNPLTLYHFPRMGLYVYASTEQILKKGLKKGMPRMEQPFEVMIREGDILRIDRQGQYSVERFDTRNLWDGTAHFSWPYWDVYAGQDEYIDDLKSVAAAYGYTPHDIDVFLSYCPIFDNGAGLLSNMRTAPMDIEPKALIAAQRARPFGTTFNRQAGAVQALYGAQLRLPKLSKEEIFARLEPLLQYYPQRDRGIITDRVCATILLRQKQL